MNEKSTVEIVEVANIGLFQNATYILDRYLNGIVANIGNW